MDMNDRRDAAAELLAKMNLPAALIDALDLSSDERMCDSAETLAKVYAEALRGAIKEALKETQKETQKEAAYTAPTAIPKAGGGARNPALRRALGLE